MTPELRTWTMTWPHAKKSYNKMSDNDFALDPGCVEQSMAPVDWQAIAQNVRATADCLKTNEKQLEERFSQGEFSFPQATCRDPLSASAEQVSIFRDVDSRYSSWRNDCYLGWLSVFLCDVVCTLHEALSGEPVGREKWPLKWKKAQLELEGLFFYVEVPWNCRLPQGPNHLTQTPKSHKP